MGTPPAGAVVLVRFPFSDLSQTKLRPAAVLADAGRDDWILCQVTSKPYGHTQVIKLEDTDFSEEESGVGSCSVHYQFIRQWELMHRIGVISPRGW